LTNQGKRVLNVSTKVPRSIILGGFFFCSLSLTALPQELSRRELARERYPDLSLQLQNPLARVLALSLDVRYETGGGPAGDGSLWAANLAPRIPFVIGDNGHLISKTEIAWVTQKNAVANGKQRGLSDLAQTFFFSPDRSIAWDLYWGIGPSFVLPTATNDVLGSEKFSLGPSFGVFRQKDPWTVGVIINHIWSVAGDSRAPDVSASLIEPLIAYTAPTGTTLALGAKARRNWKQDDWVAPIDITLSQLTLIANRPVRIGLAAQYGGPSRGTSHDWLFQLQITLPLKSPRWGIQP
jgi:hypothetical protein